ncbi:hypothetical protein DDW08_02730 [Vulcanisaeta sp. SCGC AB-777_J10]|jgi:hypothetical protein|nr:hypothetical protein DDW08_02730 [Vulcanisaeta sp. SCGC AB-777_J10]
MSSLSEEYEGVISILRFFRRSGQLYMISRFANAVDSRTALAVLEEMLELIYRLPKNKINLKEEKCKDEDKTIRVCLEDKIRREDAEWYRSLGAIVCDNNEKILIPCPEEPTQEELDKLKGAIDRLEVRPSELAALAMARSR